MNFKITKPNYNLYFAVHTGIQEHTGAYGGFLRLQEMDFVQGKNLEFFALSPVINGQSPLVSSFKQKKTQKFIYLFVRYWNLTLSDIPRYTSKLNNHTYLNKTNLTKS